MIPAETMKVRAMPRCTAHGSVGRQVVDDQDNLRRGGAIGPCAHGNVARHVVDDLNVEGSGQPKPQNDPTTSTTPVPVCQLLGSATAQGTQAAAADRTQRPGAAREGKGSWSTSSPVWGTRASPWSAARSQTQRYSPAPRRLNS